MSGDVQGSARARVAELLIDERHDDRGAQTRFEYGVGEAIGDRALEMRFRGLLAAAPDAMVIVGRTGRIELVNAQAEDLDNLFVEFQQVDGSATKKYPGTGLGLALTKRTVEAHGERIDVWSTPGRGSTLSAILPRKMVAEAAGPVRPPEQAVPGPPATRTARKFTILVIDDDPATLKVAPAGLTELGTRVICSNDATLALRQRAELLHLGAECEGSRAW